MFSSTVQIQAFSQFLLGGGDGASDHIPMASKSGPRAENLAVSMNRDQYRQLVRQCSESNHLRNEFHLAGRIKTDFMFPGPRT